MEITMKAITDSNPRIVQRIEAYFKVEGISGGRFDTYRPAAYLLQNHATLRHEIDSATIEKSASMFERINRLLETRGRDHFKSGTTISINDGTSPERTEQHQQQST